MISQQGRVVKNTIDKTEGICYNLKMIIIIKMRAKMADIKYKTKQREEILNFFIQNKDKCFSAREVCSFVKAGEATVHTKHIL